MCGRLSFEAKTISTHHVLYPKEQQQQQQHLALMCLGQSAIFAENRRPSAPGVWPLQLRTTPDT